MKKVFRVLFSLLLVFSIFGVVNVLAAENIFTITGISVKEKSDNVKVNDVSLSGDSIINDIEFNSKDDYIKYDITIKNNTSDKYKILSISDNNESSYLEYTYDDLNNAELESNEEKTFNLTITYIQKVNTLKISDQEVSLTLNYESVDGTTGSEVIGVNNNGTISNKITNPNTGDNIYLYVILGLVSIGGLVITTVSKKRIVKGIMLVALASSLIIPLGVSASSNTFVIKFINNINVSHYTITYNANGGKFSDESTINKVSYLNEKNIVTKYSYTENIDEDGNRLSDYGSGWEDDCIIGSDRGDTSKPHVITIPGATSLTIDLYYGGDQYNYYVDVIHEAVYDYSNFDWDDGTYHEYFSEEDGTYEINGNTVTNIGHDQFTIDGDSVTFGFWSSDDEVINGYGYYAIVTGDITQEIGSYEQPTSDGLVFKGWYDDAECSEGHNVDPSSVTTSTILYAKWGERDLYTIVSGDLNTRGSIIDIDGEKFELIKNYGDKVSLLSLYPLNVGPNQVDDDKKGRQDNFDGAGYNAGKIKFSNSLYWMDGENVKDEYSSSDYIFDENSNLYEYLIDYVTYLKEVNPKVISGRLWNEEEYQIYDCHFSERMCYGASDYSAGLFWTGLRLNGTNYGLATTIYRYDYYNYDVQAYLVPIIEMSIE